jgi:hypothetical protein
MEASVEVSGFGEKKKKLNAEGTKVRHRGRREIDFEGWNHAER